MTFEKDIFISYAHIDNEPLKEGEKGWVTDFHRALEVRLGILLGKKPKIWRDQKLQGNDIYADEIVDQFPKTAIMISILSPGYINSEWCIKEMKEFYKVAQEGIGVKIGNKMRIFKVVKTHVQHEKHPPEIARLPGYEFYVTNLYTGRKQELSQKCVGELEQAYFQKLDDIAHDIRDLLIKLEQNGETGISNHQPEEIVVYLAETSLELRKQRDMIKRQLIESGCRVLPDTSLPSGETEFKKSVDLLLGQCALSIHLVGGDYGPVLKDSQESKIHIQNQLAVEKSKSQEIQRLIWLSPGHYAKIEDPGEREFLRQLKTNPEFQYNADFVETHIEDFKQALRDKLESLIKEKRHKKKEEETAAVVKQDTIPKQIYLICDRKDLNHVIQLEDFLFKSGYNVDIPAFVGEEEELRRDHYANLKICDAAIIYYGAGSELWMRAISRDLIKIAGYGKENPLQVKAVFLAPPPTPTKNRFRSHGFRLHGFLTVDGMEELSPSRWKPFFDGLNSPG